MASALPSSGTFIDVGIRRVAIPDEAGRRARFWARALSSDAERRGHPEAADELSSPRVVLLLEALIQDTRNDVMLAIEKALLEEMKP